MTKKKTATKTRTVAQEKALALAKEHGFVEIGSGFGRSKGKPNVIASGTYVRLVMDGLLTPRADGTRFTGEALSVKSGKVGYLVKTAAPA